jgi:DNA polymerase III delta prime subunit
LEKENVEYNTQVVAEVIKRYFPDFRKVLNELQRYGSSGTITSGVLSLVSDISISELIDTLKQRKFTDMRNWVAHNVDNDPDTIYRKLYDGANQYVAESSIPKLVLIIADYQYKNAFVADHELNLVACLTEIMLECEFK